MSRGFTIVGIGEAVFDVFPGEHRLGGAPLNVAIHAHQLAQPYHGRGIIVSRIGQDELGDQLIKQLQERGLSTEHLQTDPDRPTGRIYIDLAPNPAPGSGGTAASYDIEPSVAWDVLQFDPDDEDLARRCDAICFGTLAQRDAQSRNAIHRFLDTARRAIRLFDVNLRSSGGKDFYDHRIIERSLHAATAIKLSEEELPIFCNLLGLDPPDTPEAIDHAVRTLLKRHELTLLALTRGARGTVVYTAQSRDEGDSATYPPAEGADSVGAGDACAAALLVGQLLRLPPSRLATFANHVGAYVASQPGATPDLPESIITLPQNLA